MAATRLESVLTDHSPHTARTRRILGEARALATAAGASATAVVEHAEHPGEQILRTAAELDVDLIVLSGTGRVIDDQLVLGATVHHVLGRPTPTLVVAITPDPDGNDAGASADAVSTDA